MNGLLIPEIEVKRGENYTIRVQAGDDSSNQAEYHPVYITDDRVGGYAQKDQTARAVSHTTFKRRIGLARPPILLLV